MQRNDIQGVQRAPESVSTYLLLKGGKNVYGEPNFRLVWAPARMKQQGGRWQDWDKNLSSRERGGLMVLASGLVIPSWHKPDRIVFEVRTVRKYGMIEGWVLERWVPSIYYGSEAEWYERCVPGTRVPFGGPWPAHGDYEMCHNSATLEVPTITELQNAMDRSERAREQRHTDVAQIVLERVNEAEWEYQEQMRKEEEEMQAMMRDVLTPLHGTSLSAGVLRNKVAERAGIFSHNGN